MICVMDVDACDSSIRDLLMSALEVCQYLSVVDA
jgi:hypothetical protein